MSLKSRQYADLAADSYQKRNPGMRSPGEEEPVISEGIEFEVLEHVENRFNGYAGTIYQRVDTGEIVVAHRGTNEVLRDGILTDATMVTSRANIQEKDALALTRRALDYANRSDSRSGQAPEVTVTGHSLGGTLAQITAHHHDLRGETFNAYGAVSLNRRIPEGGHQIMNHVMASDVVSAGAPHYGQITLYAKPEEVSRLQRFGFDNDSGGLRDAMGRSAAGVAARSLSAHSMHLFTDRDANGKPDVSVLQDPAARQLADDNAVMIGKYRGDVQTTRRVMSTGIGGVLNLKEGLDNLRGPIEPGAGRENPAYSLPEAPGSRIRTQDIRKGMDFLNPVPWQAPFNRPPATDTELKEDIQHHMQRDYPAPSRKAPGRQTSLEQDPESYVDRMLAAARSGDHDQFRTLTQQAANTTAGQQLRQDAIAQTDWQEQEQARLAAQQAQQQQQEQQQTMQGPRMRI